MKIYPLIIFLMVLSPAYAQVEDHFDDGNFNSFPSWQGNGPDFNVNAALQLQLNAVTAGNSYLSVPANLNSLDSIEWHFYIRLAFSPSSSNNARVYLSSDQSDLTRPLNGYFLQFGEALSSDAIELFRQDSSTKTSICRAADGMISTPFSVRVKVTRNGTGIWTLSVDYNGAENYNTEATGVDVIYNNASFIGVNCQYTSGNTGNFYFDDFYAGPIIGDTLPPSVTSVTAESANTLALIFSEKMENSTAVSPGSYDVNNGIGHPVTITPDTTDPLKYLLSFSDHFHPGEVNTILFSGLKDVNQNQMPDSTINFTYSPLASAQFNDVVFSEIYFENTSLSPLPDAEYVEIYNRRDSSILLEGWTISDDNTEGTIPGFRLEPHGYALLFSEDDSAGFAGFANGIGVHSFPSLNNDVGDRLVIKNANSEIITELFFNDGYYHDNQKNDGGWSVERIDVGFTCENEENWTASVSNLHGTPGAGNSVNARFIDDVRPLVSNIFLKDSNRVTIYFSENISDGLSDVNNFSVKNTSGIYTYPSSVTIISGNNIELNFASAFSGGIFFLELNPAISDCPGNKILVDDELKFGYPDRKSVV